MSGIVEKGRVRKKPRYKIKNMWEVLEDAATRKRKCFIRYKRSRKRGGGTYEYYVAPYSFRNKPGGEVLFAYDLVDGHIKSFFRDKVTGVHVTENRFVPKWDVEIGAEKTMSIYGYFKILDEIVKEKRDKTNSIEEFMNEGLSVDRGVTPADVDSEELRRGIEVELEHTKDRVLAEKIALDHLAEFSPYYTFLEIAERAMKKYKELGGDDKRDLLERLREVVDS